MSQQLSAAMKSILAMGYFKNEHAKSADVCHGHEAAVAQKLACEGFTECKASTLSKIKKEWVKVYADTGALHPALENATSSMPDGSYVLQPVGSQQFPDVLVKDFGGRLIALECKSVAGNGPPMWNDNLPRQHAIYVLTSGKEDRTTVFFGKDVITPELTALQQVMLAELQAVAAKFSALVNASDKYSRGWDTKFRPQNFQCGGAAKTNYFKHADRARCEKNVLDFANQ